MLNPHEHQVDMAIHDKQVPGKKLGIHSAAGIRHDQATCSEAMEKVHRASDLPGIMTLVSMQSPVQDRHRLTIKPATDQSPAMSQCRCRCETWQVAKLKDRLDVEFLDKFSQTGPQDDPHPRRRGPATAYKDNRLVNPLPVSHLPLHVRPGNISLPFRRPARPAPGS
jgi:hypothetical protein